MPCYRASSPAPSIGSLAGRILYSAVLCVGVQSRTSRRLSHFSPRRLTAGSFVPPGEARSGFPQTSGLTVPTCTTHANCHANPASDGTGPAKNAGMEAMGAVAAGTVIVALLADQARLHRRLPVLVNRLRRRRGR